MTENPPAPTEPAAPDHQAQTPAPALAIPAPAPDETEALRRENARLAEKLKAAEPVLEKARESEEASKSELQKARERAEKAERDAESERSLTTRLKAANRHQVGDEYFDLIAPGTPEEVEDRAKRLGRLIAQSKPAPPPSERPVESLKPGASPAKPTPPDNSYPSSWLPRHMRTQQQGA